MVKRPPCKAVFYLYYYAYQCALKQKPVMYTMTGFIKDDL